jgi:transcriptional antiterminator RfaH
LIDNSYKWYPIYTRSKAEKKVYEELFKKGIECYLPLKKVEKQWSDRKKIIEEPLLKSYLFIYISAQEHAEVLKTYGVARFIYFSGKIASMPTKQIEDLKLLLATDSELELIEQDIKIGQKVLVKAGPFKGIIGELVSLNSKKSLILRLENLGLALNIKTSMAFIEPMK